MKRDMDLVRQILINLEPVDASFDKVLNMNIGIGPLDIAGYTPDQIKYHLGIMGMGELFNYNGVRPGAGDKFEFSGLSWRGHEFIDTIRDPETWGKLKKGSSAIGAAGFGMLTELAKAYAKAEIAKHTGWMM